MMSRSEHQDMHDREKEVQKLEDRYNRDKHGLWKLLDKELNGAYDGELPTNQNVDFLHSCFSAIAPEDSPRDCLRRQFDGYSAEWEEDVSDQHYLATALKCLLHERVGREKHNTIGNPTVQYLAQLVVALRTSDEGAILDETSDLASAPTLESRPAHPYEPGFSFDRIETPALEKWVRSQQSESDGPYGVYVIDCTPKIGEDEDTRIRELRAQIHAAEDVFEPREKAAQAVNNGECVYYVGHSDHVPERMRQHAKGMTYGGAQFLSLFEPVELFEVTWYESKPRAKQYEKQRAGELTEPGGPYAFSETNQ